MNYFLEFCINTHGEQKRSSEVADLGKLDTTVSSITVARDNEIKFRTSTNGKDSKTKKFTRALLVVGIERDRDAEKEEEEEVEEQSVHS